MAFPRFLFQCEVIRIDEKTNNVDMAYRCCPVLGSLGILLLSVAPPSYATVGLLPLGLILLYIIGIGSLLSLPFLLVGVKLKNKILKDDKKAQAYLEIIDTAKKSNLLILVSEKGKYENLKEQAQNEKTNLLIEKEKIIIPDNVTGQSRMILEQEQLGWANKIRNLYSKIDSYVNKLSAIDQEIVCQKEIREAFEKYNSL